MAQYAMTCTCGDTMTVDASSKEEGVEKLAEMMGPEAVVKHFEEKHQGQPVPTQEQMRAGLEQSVHEVTA